MAGRPDLARYVDPVMVVIVSAAFLPVPARLVAGGFREVLTMSPPPELLAGIQEIVSAVEAENGFTESFLRASEVGGRLDVEIDFVVADTSATVRDFDAVRAVLQERFAAAGQPVSLSVGFTADRKWAV